MNRTPYWMAAILGAGFLLPAPVWPLGADHGDELIPGGNWPAGLAKLLETPCRVHGYLVNRNDYFFFKGDADQLNAFLAGLEKTGDSERRVVFHDGVGRAKSPWDKGEGKPCDWALDVEGHIPDAQGNIIEKRSPVRLTAHVWLAGIKRDAVRIPPSFTTLDDKKK